MEEETRKELEVEAKDKEFAEKRMPLALMALELQRYELQRVSKPYKEALKRVRSLRKEIDTLKTVLYGLG